VTLIILSKEGKTAPLEEILESLLKNTKINNIVDPLS
jgi:hypothetical protein